MPELPEVETTCRGIAPYLINKTVKGVVIRQSKLRWPITRGLAGEISGTRIESVSRRGKYLLISTSSGVLIIHLGMSGSLKIVPLKQLAEKHDHFDLLVSGEKVLRLTDPRKFGSVLWTKKENLERHKLLEKLGPEPLSDEFSCEDFYLLSRNKKVAVKNFIMNSHNVVGVGNIYANEALFRAGIKPNRPAGQISKQRYTLLVAEIKAVLSEAIKQGGTTLKDFTGGDGKPGYFKQQLAVYGRAGLPCARCAQPLKEIRMAQRSTVFCAQCQK
ncbi:MAG TPA: bifunctional DNA-formamidopyrimidine glycosylase/DNA-(apurinic or apyrimidinic site) lyase [Pseudomonadales bacterium]